MLTQLTVFLENKPGRLEEVTGCLAKADINIHALSLADTTNFGILRMIVSQPDKALEILKSNDFMVRTSEVISVAMGHSPGSLHKILKELRELDISIEYLYAFTSRHKEHDAIVILSVGDPAAAMKKLEASGFSLLGDDFINELNH